MVIETRTGSDFWVGARGQLFGGGDRGNIPGCCKCPLSSLGRGLLGHMHMLRNIGNVHLYLCISLHGTVSLLPQKNTTDQVP